MVSALLSILYLSCFAATGILLADRAIQEEPRSYQVFLGLAFGLIMLIWLPALISFVIGFTLAAQLIALVACLLLAGGLVFCRIRSHAIRIAHSAKDDIRPILWLLPLFLVGCYLFFTHTIWDKYGNGSLWVGQSTYGDLSMHLGFITSIAQQHTFPPYYSICPDTLVGYPFLCDSVSSTFYLLGASLRFSAILPSLYALLVVILGVYHFFLKWLGKSKYALFAAYLFFVGGGFGFAYFLDLAKQQPDKFLSLFTAYYETPTNYTTYGLRWVNTICDMLIPQRATLFGWAVLFPCLSLLYELAFEKKRKIAIILGIMAGCLPLIHTHSFLALGLISAVYLLIAILRREGISSIRRYLLYAAFACLLAAPQLIKFTFHQSGSFLTFNWNWDNVSDSFLWFYVKNWGLLFLLLPVAFLEAEKKDRLVFSGIALLWILSETIQFQPNPYDNNKLLFIVFAYICGLTGKWILQTAERLTESNTLRGHSPAGIYVLTGIVSIALFLSGVLTIGRECVSSYELLSAEETEAAEFIMENTEADATFLTYNNHNNAVAVLTGRNIVCGSGSFLYYHGIDYQDREAALYDMFENPADNLDLFSEYGVDYIYISAYETSVYDIDWDYFLSHCKTIYNQDGIMILDVTQAP